MGVSWVSFSSSFASVLCIFLCIHIHCTYVLSTCYFVASMGIYTVKTLLHVIAMGQLRMTGSQSDLLPRKSLFRFFFLLFKGLQFLGNLTEAIVTKLIF